MRLSSIRDQDISTQDVLNLGITPLKFVLGIFNEFYLDEYDDEELVFFYHEFFDRVEEIEKSIQQLIARR